MTFFPAEAPGGDGRFRTLPTPWGDVFVEGTQEITARAPFEGPGSPQKDLSFVIPYKIPPGTPLGAMQKPAANVCVSSGGIFNVWPVRKSGRAGYSVRD